MQPTERTYCEWTSQHPPESAIRRVLGFTQPVTVLQQRPPWADVVEPRIERVPGTRFCLERIAAPAIVVPADPEDFYARIVQIRDCCQHAKSGARHHMSPRKPKVEQIAHDHE